MESINYATVLIVLAGVLAVIHAYMAKQKNTAELEHLVKEEAYKLFLYAEKQGWIGQEKMAYVAEQIYRRVPMDAIRLIISEQVIEEYLQNLYTQFKISIAKEVDEQ
jgi:hypothetical protein